MLTRRLLLTSLATPVLAPVFANDYPTVQASFSLLSDVVKEITGAASVSYIVGSEQEVHHFELRPAHLKSIANLDTLILNGLGLEPWAEKLKVKKIIASTRVTPLANDPHAFQSLPNMMLYVDEIAANLPCPMAEAYKAKLLALDTRIKADFAKIPREKRKIVTSHDAFAYFGQEYGLDFIAPEGKMTGEPSAKALARIVNQIKSQNIKALFVENLTSKRAIETISRETGVKIGGTLYSESLAKTGEASTYLGMMAYNARLMHEALM